MFGPAHYCGCGTMASWWHFYLHSDTGSRIPVPKSLEVPQVSSVSPVSHYVMPIFDCFFMCNNDITSPLSKGYSQATPPLVYHIWPLTCFFMCNNAYDITSPQYLTFDLLFHVQQWYHVSLVQGLQPGCNVQEMPPLVYHIWPLTSDHGQHFKSHPPISSNFSLAWLDPFLSFVCTRTW